MPALIGDTVQRTFSATGGAWAGLAGAESDQAGGENIADLGDALTRVIGGSDLGFNRWAIHLKVDALAIPHRKSESGHGTQKPVECMKRPIENNSSPGQAVYEPFCGSGTTIIAAEMTGRSCHAIELNPAYVDVAVKRWQAFTGETALLDGTDRSFADIEAERVGSQSEPVAA